MLFLLHRCVTWRSLRRAATRPCHGCATSLRTEVGEKGHRSLAYERGMPICAAIRQQLGNAVQCGGNYAWKKKKHCRTWGNEATSCEMWESELLFVLFFPVFFVLRLPHLHMLVFFANVAINYQTSSCHFLSFPFILGGTHLLPTLDS